MRTPETAISKYTLPHTPTTDCLLPFLLLYACYTAHRVTDCHARRLPGLSLPRTLHEEVVFVSMSNSSDRGPYPESGLG
ncbi:hypothetical protein BDN67DRAFT_673305 [Paxillus ammoniavirescens]|nr:hypothetical protein BDN67DRAFT_673305 [Paxillus ammoniavirescens]